MIDFTTFLEEQKNESYYEDLMIKVELAYKSARIYPPREQVFRAFELCDFPDVKVVIIGQDPYHEDGQANGLAFSVNNGTKLPPSLRNIYQELAADLDCEIVDHGDLSHWARQGVLLINNVLTVQQGMANSHFNYGWQEFTARIIKTINGSTHPVVFILWGKNAQKTAKGLDSRHLVIESAHPSPLSAYRGFFGSRPFSQANEFLRKHNLGEIDWCLKK
ncbi:MAG: uracil-DNA glycosylase [Erysipelotrichaceae bacterium]|nr:uracil-DNA glycosylase [Erysipelotrichaceae bacterium]MDD3809087.1 uracil-DNA glycosylase [Erysipelotrichaceae bacterium]